MQVKNIMNVFISLMLMKTTSFNLKRMSTMKKITIKQITMKKDVPDMKSLAQYYKPKTPNQELYTKYLADPKTTLIFALGPAGTGKTMLACNEAVRQLKSGSINKIVITRPVVPVEEDIGYLPGNINHKMDPWTRPIFDVFLEFYAQRDIDLLLYNGVIEIAPLAYMRGRTFKNSFIIADEMQNSSPNQMLMLTTRIGEKSKMVVTGDLKQSDKSLNSGLLDFSNKFKLYQTVFNKRLEKEELYSNNKYDESNFNIGIKIIELNNTDIERNPVIIKLLDIYTMTDEKVKEEIKNIDNEKNKQIEEHKKIEEDKLKLKSFIQEKINNSDNNIINYKNTTKKTSKNKKIIIDDDAALIPINHITKRFNDKN